MTRWVRGNKTTRKISLHSFTWLDVFLKTILTVWMLFPRCKRHSVMWLLLAKASSCLAERMEPRLQQRLYSRWSPSALHDHGTRLEREQLQQLAGLRETAEEKLIPGWEIQTASCPAKKSDRRSQIDGSSRERAHTFKVAWSPCLPSWSQQQHLARGYSCLRMI